MLHTKSRPRHTFVYYVSLVAALFLFTPISSAFADDLYGAAVGNIAAYLDKLVSSYPDWIAARTNVYLIMKNGVKFAISDHRKFPPRAFAGRVMRPPLC